MMIGGNPKFRSSWGVCFSILTYLSVLFFAYNKMIFMYMNRSSHFVERNVYYDFNSTQGQEIMNLKENNVNVEFEFAPDPDWYKNDVKTSDNLKKHLEDFFEYLLIELVVKEVNTTSGVETETIIQPYYEIHIEPNGSPRL